MKVRPGFLIALLAVVVVSSVIVISIMRDRPNVVALTSQEAPAGVNWRVIGAFIDGPKTKFVEIKAGHAKDRAEYDNAVNTLCHETSFCTIAFFLPGDRVPTNQSAKDFFDTGGWSNYPVLAFWWGTRDSGSSRYTGWDCDRAGADGAPTDALCGLGVGEAYSAVLALAGRAGTAEACGWPKNDDAKLTLGYIDNIKEPARQEQFRKGYGLLYQTTKKGPDDSAGCSTLRSKIEASAKAARQTLGFLSPFRPDRR
jgi:hypothetical protein